MEEIDREVRNSREIDESELEHVDGGVGCVPDDIQFYLKKFAAWSINEIEGLLRDLQRGDITGSRSERSALEQLLADKKDREV